MRPEPIIKHLWASILYISYLSEDCITIVGKDYAAHGVKKHLKHALGTKGCANDVRDSLYYNKVN
jgi:hypothetical protein